MTPSERHEIPTQYRRCPVTPSGVTVLPHTPTRLHSAITRSGWARRGRKRGQSGQTTAHRPPGAAGKTGARRLSSANHRDTAGRKPSRAKRAYCPAREANFCSVLSEVSSSACQRLSPTECSGAQLLFTGREWSLRVGERTNSEGQKRRGAAFGVRSSFPNRLLESFR